MASIAAARRRLNARARRAVHNNSRRRRDSLRGYPDLFQTHRVPVGDAIDGPSSFPRPDLEVTFKFRLNRTDPVATGVLVTLGNEGSIGLDAGALEIVTGGSTFVAPFAGAPIWSAEVVVALQPIIGQVRAWVDSVCVLAGETATFPYNWIQTGSVAYASIPGAEVISELDGFELQIPRHFNECRPVDAVAFCPLLFRAARAADLATEFFPFLGEHQQ